MKPSQATQGDGEFFNDVTFRRALKSFEYKASHGPPATCAEIGANCHNKMEHTDTNMYVLGGSGSREQWGVAVDGGRWTVGGHFVGVQLPPSGNNNSPVIDNVGAIMALHWLRSGPQLFYPWLLPQTIIPLPKPPTPPPPPPARPALWCTASTTLTKTK